VTATEVPAEMHASEMAASEATEMTEPSEVTAADATEMTAAAETTEMTAADATEMTAAAAEMAAAAESTVPKGKRFAYPARHYSRRERYFEAEPERHRRCENFRPPTSHGRSPSPGGAMIPSLLRTQPTRRRFRAFHGTLRMA
jgi:hypothetical protein